MRWRVPRGTSATNCRAPGGRPAVARLLLSREPRVERAERGGRPPSPPMSRALGQDAPYEPLVAALGLPHGYGGALDHDRIRVSVWIWRSQSRRAASATVALADIGPLPSVPRGNEPNGARAAGWTSLRGLAQAGPQTARAESRPMLASTRANSQGRRLRLIALRDVCGRAACAWPRPEPICSPEKPEVHCERV